MPVQHGGTLAIEYKYTSNHEIPSEDILDRVSLDTDTYNVFIVEGGGVEWSFDTALSGGVAIVIRHYDQSRHAEYDKRFKPHVIVRCAVDAHTHNVGVYDFDSNLLYTFDTDCSATPKYCIVRLTGTRTWELA